MFKAPKYTFFTFLYSNQFFGHRPIDHIRKGFPEDGMLLLSPDPSPRTPLGFPRASSTHQVPPGEPPTLGSPPAAITAQARCKFVSGGFSASCWGKRPQVREATRLMAACSAERDKPSLVAVATVLRPRSQVSVQLG